MFPETWQRRIVPACTAKITHISEEEEKRWEIHPQRVCRLEQKLLGLALPHSRTFFFLFVLSVYEPLSFMFLNIFLVWMIVSFCVLTSLLCSFLFLISVCLPVSLSTSHLPGVHLVGVLFLPQQLAAVLLDFCLSLLCSSFLFISTFHVSVCCVYLGFFVNVTPAHPSCLHSPKFFCVFSPLMLGASLARGFPFVLTFLASLRSCFVFPFRVRDFSIKAALSGLKSCLLRLALGSSPACHTAAPRHLLYLWLVRQTVHRALTALCPWTCWYF